MYMHYTYISTIQASNKVMTKLWVIQNLANYDLMLCTILCTYQPYPWYMNCVELSNTQENSTIIIFCHSFTYMVYLTCKGKFAGESIWNVKDILNILYIFGAPSVEPLPISLKIKSSSFSINIWITISYSLGGNLNETLHK